MTTRTATTVSVIVTVFNLKRYVAASLESVLRQTYPQVELIVVDDASTDGSAQVLQGFGDRARVVTMPRNGGVLKATLAGLQAARGDIVCFLDGDDLWHPQKVASAVAAFERDSRTIVVSHDYRFVNDDGVVVQEDDPSQAELRRLVARDDRDTIDQLMRRSVLEYRGNAWLGSAWCVRRTALNMGAIESWAAALPRPDLTYQDHPLAVFLALRAPGRFDYVDAKLLDYRVHAANHSGGFAMTPERWVRVLDKGRATAVATHDLVQEHASGNTVALERQKLRLAEFDFLLALSRRDWATAGSRYVVCARKLWGPRRAVREAVRAGTIGVLGARRALELKARLARKS